MISKDLENSIENLEKIPKRRLLKEFSFMSDDFKSKIKDIKISRNSMSLSIIFNTKPYEIVLKLPKYYPFKPIECDIIYQPHATNKIIGNLLANKIPYDLVNYNLINFGIWKFLNNGKQISGKKFIYYINEEDFDYREKKIEEYDNIYTNWSPSLKIVDSLERYLNCFKPYISF
tara:strand:- start:67 stop:588 length:522 start_codon:yes stop_codon:yes gene_type:complete